jgi:hypothetical protein
MIAADEEFENLQFGTLDITASAAAFVPVAGMAFDVRILAYDGTAWWTSHCEASEIVSFTLI